jgi:histidyl-tRNA synthetase
MLQRPRGTRDFLPDEMEARRFVEAKMRETARRWGYREVCTPGFEELELFTMRSGEGIIGEMYVFEDKGGRKLALRPELTAAAIRMYVNEAKVAPKPLRWCYFGDCFRYERPQKGRYRQFWQFGVELIGADTAAADAEAILLAHDLLTAAGVTFELRVGHLSFLRRFLEDLAPGDRRKVRAFLDKDEYGGLEEFLTGLGKTELLEALVALVNARSLAEAFALAGGIPERARIEETCALLDSQDIQYRIDPGIARGLDYYTGLVFEAYAEGLGAENQIMGGGTYRLAHLFGGDDVPSCGFAIGFDRVMVARGEPVPSGERVVAVCCTEEGRKRAFEAARMFRAAGVRTEIDLMGRSLGAQLAHAAKGASFAAVIGKREAGAGTVMLKDLATGVQRELPVEEAVHEVRGTGSPEAEIANGIRRNRYL